MKLMDKLLASLFPARCVFCQQTVRHDFMICADCYQSLPHNKSCCQRCALPLLEEMNRALLCGRCIRKPPAFDYAYSPFRYEENIIGLVHQLKFSEKISYARSIGEILLQHYSASGEKPDCLLPVALHKSRLRQRGFNQSIEISRVLAKERGIPIEHSVIVRKRSTLAQAGLTAKQRAKNIRGAFSVVGKLEYKHVLIVDDVMTTGATVNELAKLLKKNNVERVGVLSIARAPMKG